MITYLNQNKKRNYVNPEEKVQAETFLNLVLTYNYPVNRIRQFVSVQMGSETKEADIIVYDDDKLESPLIVIECKKEEISDQEFETAVNQAYSYAIQSIDTYRDFKRLVGFEPVEMYSSIYDWKIAVAEKEEDILNAEPDFDALNKNGLGHLMITSKCDSKQADIVVRCFAPMSGINEDPVTGSAHCALAPLWFEKLGKAELDSLQLSKRTGLLKVKLNGERVEIKGKAITIFEAKMKI
ncbi:hypothetical protein AGMMS50262_07850 [Bacteroidia bacterium]|nr:hypothetical protein AGMMS50262_07850 [Bacteroidia bacterium]